MARELRRTVEFARVQGLPRREVRKAVARELARTLSPEFRARGSEAKLLPWQAYALAEVVTNNGALLGLPVGSGKTLLSWLLPIAMESKRPALIAPSSLRAKTYHDYASYRGEWKSPRVPPTFIGFKELPLESRHDALDRLKPDLIIIDEADELSNAKRSAVLRIDRYVVANPNTVVVPMTGTLSRKSILGYWHLLCWALREDAPVPMGGAEAKEWASVLDMSDPFRGRRLRPGPMGDTIEQAREWFAKRLRETPGVLLVDEDSCKAPLVVRTVPARESRTLDRHFRRFLEKNRTPGDIPLSDPLSKWRFDGQLGCGLYHRWNPEPPEEWLTARREFARFVRTKVKSSQRGKKPLDTEAQVARAYRDHPIVRGWLRVKGDFDANKNVEVVWCCDSTLKSAREWLQSSPGPGIVWCGSVAFAEALSDLTGLRYYGQQGLSRDGVGLHAAPPGDSLIASWGANKKGFNLQPWSRQLIVMPPQSAKWLEQIFGRSHRQGQTREVIVDILLTSGGTADLFEKAIAEAGFVQETASMTQKLLRGRIVRNEPVETESNKFRWARAEE